MDKNIKILQHILNTNLDIHYYYNFKYILNLLYKIDQTLLYIKYFITGQQKLVIIINSLILGLELRKIRESDKTLFKYHIALNCTRRS